MIKTFAISKIVFVASVLDVPDYFIAKLKKLIFNFLWSGRDKVKRTNVIQTTKNGGLK